MSNVIKTTANLVLPFDQLSGEVARETNPVVLLELAGKLQALANEATEKAKTLAEPLLALFGRSKQGE